MAKKKVYPPAFGISKEQLEKKAGEKKAGELDSLYIGFEPFYSEYLRKLSNNNVSAKTENKWGFYDKNFHTGEITRVPNGRVMFERYDELVERFNREKAFKDASFAAYWGRHRETPDFSLYDGVSDSVFGYED